ncbi:COG4223 family protein [Devosia sp. Naph2]|uniref:COG4223 family protein n=1 Tax=Devosia polycyclovorans TaxID=3345148 RepID=UPI0035D05067
MADTTGKHTPDTDPKAGEPAAAKSGPVKSGPVKPPVLEGTAKSAAGSKPADSTKSATSGSSATSGKPASATASKPAAPAPVGSGNGSGSVWIAGLVGGALGLGAAYGLAWYGLWPAPEQSAPPADPRLAQFATAIPELETVASTVQDELSTLTRRVGALETSQAEQSGNTLDMSGLASAEDLTALSTRLDELASRSSPESASPENLTAIEAELAALRTSAAETSVQLAQAREDIAALTEMTSETAGDGLNAARLPLIFSSLESAFDAGRPYETELAALRQARPDYLVPEAVADAAASGLPQPNLIANRLDAVLPDMLAGRPADTEASWQDAGLDWFRGLVAMRPTGAVEGDSPDAIIARLEAAVAARDFSAAQAELNALPRPMHDAAGGLVEDIARLAAAEEFLAQLRETALTGETGA